MGLYASYTVSSVTGTGNVTLNVTPAISLANILAKMSFVSGLKKYIIESNTTSTIVLESGGTYDDLTGATISVYKPSEYFFIDAKTGEYEDIKAALCISLASNDVKLTTKQLNYYLPIIEGEIHDFLKQENNEAFAQTDVGYSTIQGVILDLINMWLVRRGKNKVGNAPEEANFIWESCPKLTAKHQALLRPHKQKRKHFVVDFNTYQRIYP